MNLIWFRQDLRVRDNTALMEATQHGNTCAVVILSPEQWKLHDDAVIKIDFYLRQLKSLEIELKQFNIPLMVEIVPQWDDVPARLLTFANKYQVTVIHANIEIGVNELPRDAQVQTLLESHQVTVEYYHDRTIFPLESIRNQAHQPYQVFGAYKRACYEILNISVPQPLPVPKVQPHELIQRFHTSKIPSIHDFYPDAQIKYQWPVGESFALQMLEKFVDENLETYKQQRDFPNIDATSQLSPYLNLGIISIRQCLAAIFSRSNGNFHLYSDGQQTWLDELLWREFYQHILFDFPRLSKYQPFNLNTSNVPWRDAPDELNAWKFGQTGIPIVDAGIRQMLETGWMHNRVRMIVAMFLSKNLLIDWRKGEQWFMQHLIDGDLAANNGGWQWCASTGTDAVPYFRIFNPISQSQKFDSQGNYIRKWVPELAHLDAKIIHEPYAKNPNLKLNYPKPIVDLKMSRQRALAAFKSA
ncbi:cryptochrome/photolyase family protein [Acinetobacter sp. DSM 11652]|uniref:cryptochrome/photolyase family protein n=1 Tax=Acinetobacter sp. DSM 11652 TaxID=346222 RepID=UPI0008CBFC69|nr:deoxyribodipyrimidine photo-lyase [Acinetobacter sp. DSM 11652]SEL90815.1 deoxyribodipyrimidine photo-lyase [Acinetobacter sp. DSM 11652]